MADELFSFCKHTYGQISEAIGTNVIEQKNTISFTSSVQMLEAYRRRLDEDGSYISAITNKDIYSKWFNVVFDCFEISPTYLIDLRTLIAEWRKQLQLSGSLLDENSMLKI
jgi:hypothetical protein